jgi:acetyl-CoA/propionyl-CoA carboxylase biotin carboxyl carrier protein
VAVYSEADRRALHVRLADEAYFLGGPGASESYLSVDRLVDAIGRSGADAVHPGYGFLAENAVIAQAPIDAGAVWVGPPPGVIEVMGDKISSRAAATKAGVAPVPGTGAPLSGAAEVVEFGDAVGWPVAIKAAFGGGGRGMRVVSSPADAPDALESAQREAEKSFGRPECYLEKYFLWPRHVEVQVFADSYGHVVHLGTRDCSVQRRHQKLIEEAPAPGLPSSVISDLGEAAVRVARGCGYENAGTVEFIYQDGEFYFLEMNTRLQVEHPVTELVTGLDLVGLQFLVASGQQIPFAQADVQLQGHSIEARVNAEDPADGRFTPTPGLVTRLSIAGGPWVRTDHGYEAGDTVSQYYDNLVAKVVAWGPDRESARRRLVRALTETDVEGIPTTIPAHLAVLSHPDFVSCRHSTTWLSERVDLSGLAPVQHDPGLHPGKERKDLEVEVDGRLFEVKVWAPQTGGAPSGPAPLRPSGTGPRQRPATLSRAPSSAPPSATTGGQISVPMQGTVVKVLVKPGDLVEAGQAVCVLEAMKMENNIVSQFAGQVTEVRVEAGDPVGTGDVIVVLGPSAG